MDDFMDWVHRVDMPARKRDPAKPFSVIASGMPRSATDSLAKALTMLGYGNVYHGRRPPEEPGECMAFLVAQRSKWEGKGVELDAAFWDSVLGDCMAVTDFPCAMFSLDLMAAYPDARVILNTRDVDAWYHSVQVALEIYSRNKGRMAWYEYFDTRAFWMRRLIQRIWAPEVRGDFVVNGKRMYLEHCAKIRRSVPRERLLEWHVDQGWGPLCEFLGQPIPNVPFPEGNSTAIVVPQLAEYTRRLQRNARKKMAIGLGWFGTTVAMGVWLTKLRKWW